MGGFFESTQKTGVELPPPTQAELSLGNAIDGATAAYMDEIGWETNKRVNPEWDKRRKEMDSINDQIRRYEQGGIDGREGKDVYKKEIKKLVEQRDRLGTDMANIPQELTEYRKKGSPEAEDARDKYGEDSPEYKAIVEKERAQVIADDKAQKELMQTYMQQAQKLANGDFSATPEQKALIQEILKPQRAAIEAMNAELQKEIDRGYSEERATIGEGESSQMKEIEGTRGRLRGEVGTAESVGLSEAEKSLAGSKSVLERASSLLFGYIDKAESSGLSALDAFDAVSNQIDKTGIDLNTALDNVVSTRQELLKMGIEDFNGELTKNMAEQAARMGRTPQDPSYQKEIQQTVAREVIRGNLQIQEMAQQGKLSIGQMTGEARQALEAERARMKVGITQEAGARRIGAQEQRGQQELGLEEQLGARRLGIRGEAGMRNLAIEEAAGQSRLGVSNWAAQSNLGASQNAALRRLTAAQNVGAMRLGVEENAGNLELQAGSFGLVGAQGTGMGLGLMGYQNAVQQQGYANLAGGQGMLSQRMQQYIQGRMAQAQQVTTSTPSPFGIALGIAGLGTAIGAAASGGGDKHT